MDAIIHLKVVEIQNPTPTRTAETPAAPPAKKDLTWSNLGGSDLVFVSLIY